MSAADTKERFTKLPSHLLQFLRTNVISLEKHNDMKKEVYHVLSRTNVFQLCVFPHRVYQFYVFLPRVFQFYVFLPRIFPYYCNPNPCILTLLYSFPMYSHPCIQYTHTIAFLPYVFPSYIYPYYYIPAPCIPSPCISTPLYS